MTTGALSGAGLERLDAVMAGHAERGDVPGLVWLVARRGEVHAGSAGDVVGRDAVFRVSSMTKPVTAVAAMVLLEECRLRLDDPVDAWLPELADRRVLARPDGPLDHTVPARRPITVRDVLTFRLGLGMDFAAAGPQPVLEAMAALELGAGPPAPAEPPEPDEWLRRLGTLPLAAQPGERWLYDTGSAVLGVLVARASGQPFDGFLRERVLGPLGMRDTGFSVPDGERHRFGPCWTADPATGERTVYDPVDGQWSRPPAFPAGNAGLVSTVDDYLAFASMLLAGGRHAGGRLLARPTVAAMTTDHVGGAGPSPDGSVGWGFGVGVQLRRTGPARSVGSYGWDGGLGSSWANDPAEGLVGILMTDRTWSSPSPPAVCRDFWAAAYAAIDD
ncbi:MAG TPA: serine hydrolase domain-containing protein [Acidimicrobiales bacterium]|jgi:CubicO group peptidase (beta-lactamase class C family)